jgi:hypothetical protein
MATLDQEDLMNIEALIRRITGNPSPPVQTGSELCHIIATQGIDAARQYAKNKLRRDK